MPDKDGKLSAEEELAATERFEGFEKEMGRDLNCEVCGNIVWSLNAHLLSLYSDSPSGALGAKKRVPLVQWYCTNCGNSKLFAARLWDIEPLTPEGVEATETDPKPTRLKITAKQKAARDKAREKAAAEKDAANGD